MTYNIQQISDEIYRDLEASDTSPGEIGLWLRGHLGELNNLLNTEYYIKEADGDFNEYLNENIKSIFKKLYEIYYYGKIIRSNLGASAFTAVIEVSDDNGRVRLANKNEISKTYLDLKDKATVELDGLIESYNLNSASTAYSVDGIDGEVIKEEEIY